MAETIYALASGGAKAGIAVIRLSGPSAGEVVRALTPGAPFPAPRRAVRRVFRHPQSGRALDDGLALWFPGPRSYTGEDAAELHIHGGRAVRAALLDALAALPGCRLAEPGEFTRRAFLNDRLDLSQAEGVVDLIEAETEAQRRQALRQAEGALGRRCAAWAERLMRLAAHAEAWIDFPDEDLPAESRDRNEFEMQQLEAELTQEIEGSVRSERLRDGVRVAIVGPPNAGKSSVLNRLAGREAAIVHARAGTTRDVVEVGLDLAGVPVVAADTAGLREAADEIEAEGVRRARAAAAAADVVVCVAAVTDPAAPALWTDARAAYPEAAVLLVANKSDLLTQDAAASGIGGAAGEPVLFVSAQTGAGIEVLVDRLAAAAAEAAGAGEEAGLTRARHREAAAECLAALRRARRAPSPDLEAEDLRLALRAIGRITGKVDVEDLLDVVFRDFCIGK
ncbi:MAG: tRNA uridine-5-carboxymethylaminomethyl(34) synthesis GTPase MnmE [Marivibrio sp.]|uniref:tRNA uridine-5-carboxymethylaminomethyl(34) synthesis GTPase MnmE n=1 Tax=Marivibrio sp. TaxID=2039719 RepID=UPI0032EDF0BC